jgi:1-aminocyclopropane-1-carboxylate deaminase/D-cysteine desulfhydrase-like pyridoxal-dependent ACC family enzyme
VGVSVQQPADRLLPWICRSAEAIAVRLAIPERLDERDFDLIDSQIGPGYGLPSPPSLEAVRLAGRTEALVLDPVYTGKALAGMAAAVREGRYGNRPSALFLHSGGTPGTFVHAAAFFASPERS